MCLRYTYNTSVLLVTFTVYPDHRKSVSSWSGVFLLCVGWSCQTFIFLYQLSPLSFTRTYFPHYSLFPRNVASFSLLYRYFHTRMFRSPHSLVQSVPTSMSRESNHPNFPRISLIREIAFFPEKCYSVDAFLNNP